MSLHALTVPRSQNVILPTPTRSELIYDLTVSPVKVSPIQARITMLELECNEFKKRERDQEDEIKILKKSVAFLMSSVQILKERVLPPKTETKDFDTFMLNYKKDIPLTLPPEIKKDLSLTLPPTIKRTTLYPVWTVPVAPPPTPMAQKFAPAPVLTHSMDRYLCKSPPRPIPELMDFPSPGSVGSKRSVSFFDVEVPFEY